MNEKEKYVHSVFQTVAGGYDRANERISMGQHIRWKRKAVKICCEGLRADASFLDVGCGTGDMLLLTAAEHPQMKMTGMDFSENMLKVAEKKCTGLDSLRLVEGNAMQLPFADNSFDCADISFALRNTADYGRVISEMSRVVRPGGRICCIDSFVPGSKLIRPAYEVYFSLLMPLLGGGIKKLKQYSWLSRSTKAFISARELGGVMKAAGIENVRYDSFMFGACVCVSGQKQRVSYEI